jgi:hypothetical protein
MKLLIFRFRDLGIPLGETIKRHRARIDAHGSVWWGWMMRLAERFPEQLLSDLAVRLEEAQEIDVYLYHSSERCLYPAVLKGVVAYPGGALIQTPEVHKTPTYMAEAECPAWFELSAIRAPESKTSLRIRGFPTLGEMFDIDRKLLDYEYLKLDELWLSTATLWEVEVAHKEDLFAP